MRTTVGQLLINDALPAQYRDYGRVLDRKGMKELALRLSQDEPSAYRDVMFKLHQVGGLVAHATGGSFRPSDMQPDPITRKQLESVRARVRDLVNDDTLDDDQRAEAIQNVVLGSIDPIEKSLYDEGLKNGNVLALQIHSGSRGKKADIRAIAAGEFMVADHKNRVIPMPILRGYSEGLSPAEQWAASYGTRKGQAATKLLVADAGYFCLAADTLVRMGDMSARRIDSLKSGDEIVGADECGRRIVVKVSGVCNAGDKPVWRWTFRRGSSRTAVETLVATEEHEVYAHARRGTGSVVAGMYPLKRVRGAYSLLPVGEPAQPAAAEEWRAFLLGALLGDGGLTGNNTMFSCADPALVAYMSDYLGVHGYSFDRVNRRTGPLYEYAIKEIVASPLVRGAGGRVIGGRRRDPLRAWLDSMGVLGKSAPEKHIPACVFGWPERDVAEFVSGLLETDGSVNSVEGCPQMRFAVTSRPLAEGLMRLMELKLGVYATGISVVDNVGKVLTRVDYAGKRRELRHNYPAYGFSIANMSALRTLVASLPVRGKKLAKLRRMVSEFRGSGRVSPFSFGYVGREYIGVVPTYDIEVDHPAHRFVLANGMVVGNSKKIMQAAHRQVVTEPDCKTEAGIPVDAQDPDNVGAVLARSAGGVPAGTIIDAEVMRKLGDQKILVRSPMTCSAENGVCAHCAGIRERGTFPDIGDNIGITAAQAVGEKVSQGTLGCLARGTLVRMANWTVRPIEMLQPGDMVVGVDRTGDTFPTPVLRVFDSGVKECNTYTFRQPRRHSGEVLLTATADHKLLAVTCATGCSEEKFNHIRRILPVGTKRSEFAAASVESSAAEWGTVHEPRALLLGMLTGDGCYTESVKSVYFSCADPALVEETKDYMATLNLRLVFHKGSQCYWRVSSIEDPVHQDEDTGRMLRGSRNPAKRMLEEFGLYGRYSYEKELPAVSRRWDNASVAALIGGLWVTDGSVYSIDGNAMLNFASTSKRLVDQVQELLEWRFGIHCTRNVNTYGGRKRPLYCINISDWNTVCRFARVIPLYGSRRAKLEAAMSRGSVAVRRTRGPRKYVRTGATPVGLVQTYDIEIGTADHLFLLANGLVVSNSKHGGGRATKETSAERLGGLPLLTQFIDLPSEFRDAATLAQMDGEVESVDDAPQGGKNIVIDGEVHYVKPGFNVTVKPGQQVQRGQQLSEGWINPAETTQMKGLGAARLQLVQSYRDALKANGVQANRRNLEVIARGLLNHVRVTDLDGTEGLPGDVTEYGALSRTYRPRYGFRQVPARKSVGMYLEKPALYHTIGTKVTKDIADELEEFGVKDVVAHDDPPPFEPMAVRAMETSMRSPDWQVRFGGSYLQKGLLEAAQRGRDSELHSTSFVPPLMKAVDFGKDLRTKGVY